MQEFSKWLEEQMDDRGWSKSELARRSGVDTGTISNVVNGIRKAGPEVCRALAAAFGIPQAVVFFQAGLLTEDPEDPRLALDGLALQIVSEVADKPDSVKRAALAALQALFESLDAGASGRDNSRNREPSSRQDKG